MRSIYEPLNNFNNFDALPFDLWNEFIVSAMLLQSDTIEICYSVCGTNFADFFNEDLHTMSRLR